MTSLGENLGRPDKRPLRRPSERFFGRSSMAASIFFWSMDLTASFESSMTRWN
jgi:hypothetical protein